MSRDLYKSRKMYESPLYLILMIPLGVILIVFLCSFLYGKYFERKLYKDCEEAFAISMDVTGLETETQMQNYIANKLEEKGYNKDELKVNIIFKDEETILIVYAEYYSILDSFITRNTKMTNVKMKAYYDEYKQTVIEEYLDDIDDIIIKPSDKEKTDTDNEKE